MLQLNEADICLKSVSDCVLEGTHHCVIVPTFFCSLPTQITLTVPYIFVKTRRIFIPKKKKYDLDFTGCVL